MARPLATDVISRYEEAKTIRSTHEPDWRMASAHCLPRQYGGWQTTGPANNNGGVASARRVAYDTTGMRALPKYAAVLERMCTPHNMKWQGLTVADTSLRRQRRVREFFDTLRDELFRMRYIAQANFKEAVSETYINLGVYGTGPIYYGRRRPDAVYKGASFLYKACPMRDIFFLVNDNGDKDTAFRRFYINIRQYRLKFPDLPLPPIMEARVKNGVQPKEGDYFEFVHVVHQRSDHDPEAIDARRHPFVGSYISVQDRAYVGEEEGFASQPYLCPTTYTEAGDPYGFSPAAQALGAMGTASQMKKTNLKQGQKAADPVLLAHDDGVVNGPVDLRPGAVNYGGVDRQGRKLIHALDAGNFQVSEKLLEMERQDINDSFFVTLFQILTETPEMTAAEVYERVAEKSALLSPTMGRIQSGLLAPGTLREIDMLAEMGRMPELPPELIEAGGEYDIIYTSPMAKGMYAEEVSAFMRSVQMALEIVNSTGDRSHLDHFNFNVAIPEMSDYMAVPARWMNDDKIKANIAKARAEQTQQEQMMKNAAPIAGAMKTMASMQEQ